MFRITKTRYSNLQYTLLAFVATLAVIASLLHVYLGIQNNLRQQELAALATSTANKITGVITDRLWKAGTLATLIVQGNGVLRDFDEVAAILLNDPHIMNVSLAPNGIVEKIFPLAGNESVIGLDFVGSGGKSEARSAITSGVLTLAGPFKMIQGGEALTGRFPVYLENNGKREFWGLVGIALKYPEVLDAAYIGELYQQGFTGKIWRYHPETGSQQLIWESDASPLDNPQTREVKLFNVTWYISVAHIPDQYATIWWTAAIGVCLVTSMLVASLTFHYLELRTMKILLESMAMTDALTGLANRRAFISRLSASVCRAKTAGTRFTLIYADLNGFKRVNDVYSHETGDQVLMETASILEAATKGKGCVYRVGGDEFTVILPNLEPGDELTSLLADIDTSLQNAMSKESLRLNMEIQITVSLGIAVFPDDGEDTQQLLHCADSRMFEQKRKFYAGEYTFKPHFREQSIRPKW